jgi:hypothetical protein
VPSRDHRLAEHSSGRPPSLGALRGKVVLVDFRAYPCINCQRTLLPVEAWHRRCAKDGSAVVAAHTPEFAHEHVVPDVRAQAAALGEHYHAATDDNHATWPLTRARRPKRQADAHDSLVHWTWTRKPPGGWFDQLTISDGSTPEHLARPQSPT